MKTPSVIALVAVILVIIIGGIYLAGYGNNAYNNGAPQAPDAGDEQVFCTADAMLCPDGTYVGRTGPNCEFVCPAVSTSTPATSIPPTSDPRTSTFDAGISVEGRALGVAVMPLEVLEDSRCPINAVCIQAGTVRLRANLSGPTGSSPQNFTLNTPVTTATDVITLTGVSPSAHTEQTINPNDYTFTFTVTKR